MLHRRVAVSIFAALAPFAFSACSDQSPLGSETTSDNVESPMLARGAAGTLYQLEVYATQIGTGAVLDAYVLDASGNPATDGTAVFYYCSLRGNPTESADCVTGSGRWRRYGSVGFFPRPETDAALGHALLGYTEPPPSGTTIGFRFRYSRGSTIASQFSNTANYTWP
jgi:hypothetical protein